MFFTMTFPVTDIITFSQVIISVFFSSNLFQMDDIVFVEKLLEDVQRKQKGQKTAQIRKLAEAICKLGESGNADNYAPSWLYGAGASTVGTGAAVGISEWLRRKERAKAKAGLGETHATPRGIVQNVLNASDGKEPLKPYTYYFDKTHKNPDGTFTTRVGGRVIHGSGDAVDLATRRMPFRHHPPNALIITAVMERV
jgi:hypothetical protein